jgi:F-type H+-transporting ATPase subunit gamma
MQNLEGIKRNIRSADDLYAIVRTMKSIAMVNIRHYEQVVEAVTEYYRTVELGLQAVLMGQPMSFLQRLAGGLPGGLAAVVFGSDQGLAGGFNDLVVSNAMVGMSEAEPDSGQRLVICIGARAGALLEDRGQPLAEYLPVPTTVGTVNQAVQQVVLTISDWREQKRISRVMLFYNRPVATAAYESHNSLLLPLSPAWLREISDRKWPTRSYPLYPMGREELFSPLVQQYIYVTLFRAFAESMASENAARLASMQAAQKNIEERLDLLGAQYRDLRQTSITSELLDVISGFEALS